MFATAIVVCTLVNIWREGGREGGRKREGGREGERGVEKEVRRWKEYSVRPLLLYRVSHFPNI